MPPAACRRASDVAQFPGQPRIEITEDLIRLVRREQRLLHRVDGGLILARGLQREESEQLLADCRAFLEDALAK